MIRYYGYDAEDDTAISKRRFVICAYDYIPPKNWSYYYNGMQVSPKQFFYECFNRNKLDDEWFTFAS